MTCSKWIAALIFAVVFVLLPVSAFTEIITVRDKLNREVALKLPVQRVVVLETYEVTAALDVWDRVVGISRFAYENDLIRAVKPDIIRTIPAVGSSLEVNVEALLRLRPDLVITWAYRPEAVRFLERRGLKVLALYPESISELYETMRLLGRIFGREKRVEACIAKMETLRDFVAGRCRRLPPEKRKRVLWLGARPTTVSGGIGINNDLIALTNSINPGAYYGERTVEVSMERIVGWNPEAVFIWGNARYGPEDLYRSVHWQYVDAVRYGRVYKAPKGSVWSPRLAVLALWMAEKTYPHLFKDVAFGRVADEFCQAVYGVSYRIVAGGGHD